MKRRGKSTCLFVITLFLSSLLAASIASAGVGKVLCVPWQGNANSPHTAISTKPVNLFAVIYGDSSGGTYTYSWDFKDGSAPATGSVSVPANGIANLKVSHTFTGALNSAFSTTLTVGGLSDDYKVIIAPDNDSSKVNIAIDNGLWYLHTVQTRSTGGDPIVPTSYWGGTIYGTWYVGATGAAVWAFEVQGHLLTVETDPLAPVEDPYVEDVQRGINFLLTRIYPQTLGNQGGENPDTNGNGYGLVAYYDSGHTNYENGPAMGAIVGSGKPDALAATSPGGSYKSYVYNRTYKEIVQDMADWYAWSQTDDAAFPPNGNRGGWYYTALDNASWGAYYGDNSASQWAYIGLEAAQNTFGCTISPWMKARLAGYLHGQIAYNNRGFVSYRSGYSWYSDFYTGNVCLTGGALVGMALVGQTAYDAQNGAGAFAADQALVKNFLGANWRGQDWRWTENWYGHRAYYTMYALMKGFRLNGIESLSASPGTSNWYDDYVGVMLGPSSQQGQYADGHWFGSGWMDSYIQSQIGTAFGVLILTPSVFSPPPVACFSAKPNPGYKDLDIAFDPACSYHSDSAKSLVLYEWDWDSDGTYDESTATPMEVKHQWNALGTYKVTLRVTDNTTPTPVTASFALNISISLPPHPPVADAGGPYTASLCSNDTLKLDGSKSFDIDQGQSESGASPFDGIISWQWDLNGSPWNYDNGSGVSLTLNGVSIASFFPAAGSFQIGIKVTDNTKLAFPGSLKDNLTDEAFGTVNVKAACLCELTARAKTGMVQLNWGAMESGATYNIYRSTAGPNTGFTLIKSGYTNAYPVFVDTGLTNGTTYYYRVDKVNANGVCGSKAVSAKPVALK